jgi:exosortase C (VPDSG-CTERM-specific)
VFTAIALTVCFAKPLYGLFQFAIHSDLYSHVLLVPFISGYLIWLDRAKLISRFTAAPITGLLLLVAGAILVATSWMANLNVTDRLSFLILAFLLLFSGTAVFLLGGAAVRPVLFPLAFLFFMAPFPSFLEHEFVSLLQHRSADVLYLMFKMTGVPVLREGTQFQLPGLSPFVVAPECCGIHSTLVFFIIGLVAGHVFLRTIRFQAALAIGVLALGVLRNAFRIFTLGELSIHVNPQIMDSGLHHRGGPVFFAVFLVPFLILVWLLRRLECRSLTKN